MPGHVLSLIIAPLHGGPGPRVIHASLGPPESITQTASQSVQLLLHSSCPCRRACQGMPFPSKLPLAKGDLHSHLICGSLGSPDSASQVTSRLVEPFLHSSRQKVPILYNGRPFPSKLPFPMGDLDQHLIHDSLWPSKPITQMASQSVQPFFAQFTAECPYTYNGTPLFPQKLPLPMGGSGPHLIHGSLGLPSPQPKRHLDRFSHFCRAYFCDRPTDRLLGR